MGNGNRPIPDEVVAEIRAAVHADPMRIADRYLTPALGHPRKEKSGYRWPGALGGVKLTTSGKNAGRFWSFTENWGGDGLTVIRKYAGGSYGETLTEAAALYGIETEGQHDRAEAERRRQAAIERERAARERHEAASEEIDREAIEKARHIARASIGITADSVADRYLTTRRGLPRPREGWPASVRYLAPADCQRILQLGAKGRHGALITIATDDDGAVVATQATFLDPSNPKGRVTTGVGKQTVGRPSRGFIRLPQRADAMPQMPSGAILLAEGIETGLSAWLASGSTSWVTTGTRSEMTFPAGAVVLQCRDDDPAAIEGKVGGLELSLANETRFRDAGHRVFVIHPWPERRGDKSDLNDTIRAGGIEAVRERLLAALTPPPITGPGKPTGLTLAEGRAKIAEHAAIAIDRMKAYREAHPYGWVHERRELDAAAKEAAVASGNVQKLPDPERPPALFLHATVGGGKTHNAVMPVAVAGVLHERELMVRRVAEIEAGRSEWVEKAAAAEKAAYATAIDGGEDESTADDLAGRASDRVMRRYADARRDASRLYVGAVLEQTIAKADELLPDIKNALAAIDATAMVWRGLMQDDPAQPGKQMCHRPTDVRRFLDRGLRSVGHSIKSYLCERRDEDGKTVRCPLFDHCGYQAQRQRLKSLKPAVIVAAHSALTSPSEALPRVAWIVCDENPHGVADRVGEDDRDQMISPAMVERTLAEATRPARMSTIWYDEASYARRMLAEITQVNGEGPLRRSALEERAITAERLRELLRTERLVTEGIGDTPGVLPEVDPDAVMEGDKEAIQAVRLHRESHAVRRTYRLLAEFLEDDQKPEKSGRVGVTKPIDGGEAQLTIKASASLNKTMIAPILILSATLHPSAVAHLWPEMESFPRIDINAPFERRIRLAGEFGKSLFFDYSRGAENATPRSAAFRDLNAFLMMVRHTLPGSALVGLQKQLIESGLMDPPAEYDLANYGGVSGRNDWKGVGLTTTVGRSLPTVRTIERVAEARTGRAVDPIPEDERGRVMFPRDGHGHPFHPNPDADAVLQQQLEEHLVQMEGRNRAVMRGADDPTITLRLHTMRLPTDDHLVLDDHAFDAGPVWRQLAAGGIAYQSPAHAACAYRGLLYGRTETEALDAARRSALDRIKRTPDYRDTDKEGRAALRQTAENEAAESFSYDPEDELRRAKKAAAKEFERDQTDSAPHRNQLLAALVATPSQWATFPLNISLNGNVAHWNAVQDREAGIAPHLQLRTATYQLAGGRQRPARVTFDPGQMSDEEARARVEANIGPLAMFVVDQPPEPPELPPDRPQRAAEAREQEFLPTPAPSDAALRIPLSVLETPLVHVGGVAFATGCTASTEGLSGSASLAHTRAYCVENSPNPAENSGAEQEIRPPLPDPDAIELPAIALPPSRAHRVAVPTVMIMPTWRTGGIDNETSSLRPVEHSTGHGLGAEDEGDDPALAWLGCAVRTVTLSQIERDMMRPG